ncbi:MAG: 2TM domain-containing protein [Bergeyella sp.]
MEIINTMENKELAYAKAKKRVQKIKGLYSHLAVYIMVNIFLFIINYPELEKRDAFSSFSWELWATPVFWGIGLLVHAATVFLPGFFLGKDWEELKIRELMEKEKHNF